MSAWYLTFKFLHVTAVIIWVGGVVTLTLLGARLARERDGVAARLFSGQSEFLGRSVVGPAAGLTLVTGLATMGVGRLGFPLWMMLGLTVMLVSAALGGTVLRKTGTELATLAAAPNPDPQRAMLLRGRLQKLSILNALLLLSAVAAMVFKPTL